MSYAGTPAVRRSRCCCTTPATLPAAYTTSSSAVNRPSPKRSVARASSGRSPMARSTWDGSGALELQAEPAETATSFISIISPSARVPGERQVRVVRETEFWVPVDDHIPERRFHQRHKPIPQVPDARRLVREIFAGDARSSAESHNRGDVQRPGPEAALMSSAVDLRLHAHARRGFPDVQRSRTLRTVHLVRAERHQIDAERVHVDRNIPDCLCRIRVQQHASRAAEARYRPQILHRPDFVVGEHHAHQHRPLSEGG